MKCAFAPEGTTCENCPYRTPLVLLSNVERQVCEINKKLVETQKLLEGDDVEEEHADDPWKYTLR